MISPLVWGYFNELIEFELGSSHGVAVDRLVGADLLKHIVLVDE